MASELPLWLPSLPLPRVGLAKLMDARSLDLTSVIATLLLMAPVRLGWKSNSQTHYKHAILGQAPQLISVLQLSCTLPRFGRISQTVCVLELLFSYLRQLLVHEQVAWQEKLQIPKQQTTFRCPHRFGMPYARRGRDGSHSGSSDGMLQGTSTPMTTHCKFP